METQAGAFSLTISDLKRASILFRKILLVCGSVDSPNRSKSCILMVLSFQRERTDAPIREICSLPVGECIYVIDALLEPLDHLLVEADMLLHDGVGRTALQGFGAGIVE